MEKWEVVDDENKHDVLYILLLSPHLPYLYLCIPSCSHGVSVSACRLHYNNNFRYHDCTLAFITSHYAADTKGHSYLQQRNADATRTLRELWLEDTMGGFDVHFQHDYCVSSSIIHFFCSFSIIYTYVYPEVVGG